MGAWWSEFEALPANILCRSVINGRGTIWKTRQCSEIATCGDADDIADLADIDDLIPLYEHDHLYVIKERILRW